MATNTKEKILQAALILFAEKGYDGTNIESIAQAVGIVKSALYRHFKSKEEILNAVSEQVTAYYEEHFGSADHLPYLPQNTDELYHLTMEMVNFTVHDKTIIRMRKIILTEQFRDEQMRQLASRYFIEGVKAIFEKVFTEMIKAGTIKNCDAGFLAFSYTAPITILIHLCDREPEKKAETITRVEAFVRQFIETYQNKNDDSTAETVAGMTLLGML